MAKATESTLNRVIGREGVRENTSDDPEVVRLLNRDPADIKLILRLCLSLMVLVCILFTSIGMNFYQYVRRPDRIVVDRSSGRVLQIDDRNFGETEAVQLGPDHLTDADKIYLASEFVKSLYQIDPSSRNVDIERALRMMVPGSALKFAQYLKDQRILDTQRAESWQSTWAAQDISVDAKDPYTVRVIGKQELTRLVDGVARQETKQLNLSLKLAADPKRRADANLRTGFLVAILDYKELPVGNVPKS